ncbi:MAG: membrane protein insertase YidC [Geodermatophilaceae bacterium]|nr:membrane protein insertase YidC [Geodermatophilaceae bacterium]
MFEWLYTAISWVLKMWHSLFSTFLPAASGLTWALSIVFLVITVRILLFRLFVKQVRSQRAMQELQPEIAKLKKQYGSDRQGMAQAMSALQKERGVNPLAGCLPILPQIPVFIGLLHVLRRLRPGADGLYGWDDTLTDQAASAKVFGAPISSAFFMPDGVKTDSILALPSELSTIRIVTTILIVVMCLTTFFTQKQIMSRSGPVEGQAAMIQKLLLYGMPLGLFVSSFFFPLGVLMYWFVNNLWTLGQQFYILKKLPPPGSAGALAKAEADRPKVDPKELAPKPGAKPVRGPKGRTPVVNAATAARLDDAEGDGDIGAGVSATAKGSQPVKRSAAGSSTVSSNGRVKRSGKPSGAGQDGSQPNKVSHSASGDSPPNKIVGETGSPTPNKPRAKAGSGGRPADRPGTNKTRRKRR